MKFHHFVQLVSRIVASLALGLPCALPSFAAEIPVEIKDAGITEKLGTSVSIAELTFRNEEGENVRLADYFKKGRPVLLNLGYYGCPTLCSFVLNGLVDSLKRIEWVPGAQFELVSVSIDPTETHGLAAKKKANYLESYGKPTAAAGWHFLTGDEPQIKKLTSQVGFGYRYDETEKQYAHGAALIVLTPEGKVSRYLYGIQFQPKDLRLALVEGSNGRIGTVIDRFLLFCYRYDPKQRKYSVYLTRVMQTGGAGTVVFLGGYLALFWRGQRRRRESDSHV